MSEDIEDNEQEMADDFDRGEIQHSVESIALKQALAQVSKHLRKTLSTFCSRLHLKRNVHVACATMCFCYLNVNII